MRRARARTALRTLMPALAGAVRVWECGEGVVAGVVAAALTVVAVLFVVAALVFLVDVFGLTEGDVLDDTIVERDECEERVTEESRDEGAEAGSVEKGADDAIIETSVDDRVCIAVGFEVPPSLLSAERPHV